METLSGLVNTDFSILGRDKSDPYVELFMMADGSRHSFHTRTIKNNLNPKWETMYDLPIDDPNSISDLKLEVWDDDSVTSTDSLGKCTVPLQAINKAIHEHGEFQDVWMELEDIEKGSIHVSVGWLDLKTSEPPKPSVKEAVC